jgi:preprotein translocase subunit YajC
MTTTPIKANAEFVDSLNIVRLKEEEIIEAISATLESADSGECCLRSLATPIRLFPTAPHKARAVIFRLQALALMMERNELKDWMQPGGGILTSAGQRAVIAAVTSHPLSLVNGDITFEKESFYRRILELAEPQSKNSN